MPVTASDYLSLTLRINELEEIVAELKNDNEEKAKIIAERTKQIEELKAKLAKYENPYTSIHRFDLRYVAITGKDVYAELKKLLVNELCLK